MPRVVAAYIIAIGLLVAALTTSHRRALALRRASPVDAHTYVPPREIARVLAVGQNELLADLAWIKALVYYGNGLVHDTGMPDADELVDLINTLDPHFRRPYAWGAYATTFRKRTATQDEYQASAKILRRAVATFPGDWEFAWLLGLRLYFDIKGGTPEEQRQRREEGAMYIERAMRLPGASSDLPLLATSLRTRLGQKERALRELREMILTTENEKARRQLQARYAALQGSADESAELGAQARRLDQLWKQTFPYASRTFYILVGPSPDGVVNLEAIAQGESFEVE